MNNSIAPLPTLPTYFDALEALRGFAALMVVLYHLTGDWAGYLAVDFFLILSGFILTHTTHYSSAPPTARDFILKRLFRLYPLHFFTLLTFTAASFFVNRELPHPPEGILYTFLLQLSLLNNVGLHEGLFWNYPSWSISVEFWVNVFFIFCIPRTTPTPILILLAILPLALISAMTGYINVHYQNYFSVLNAGLLRGLGCFCLGILAYRFYRNPKMEKLKNHIRIHVGLYQMMSIIAVVILLVLHTTTKTQVDFLAIPLFFSLVVLFAEDGGKITKFISDFKYLGTLSYSIYLNQITVILLLTHLFDMYEWSKKYEIGIILFVLILYSHITYRYIEKPAKKFLNRTYLEKPPCQTT